MIGLKQTTKKEIRAAIDRKNSSARITVKKKNSAYLNFYEGIDEKL